MMACLLVFLTITMFGFVMQHELVHVRIFKMYGINATITFDLTSALTTPDYENRSYNLTTLDWANIKEQHIQNEIVGYNVLWNILSMWFLGIMVVMFMPLGKITTSVPRPIQKKSNKERINWNKNLDWSWNDDEKKETPTQSKYEVL